MQWIHSLSPGELLALGLGVQWVFAAIAHSLPKPDTSSSKFYQFSYTFIQFLMSNLSLIRAAQAPPKDTTSN